MWRFLIPVQLPIKLGNNIYQHKAIVYLETASYMKEWAAKGLGKKDFQ